MEGRLSKFFFCNAGFCVEVFFCFQFWAAGLVMIQHIDAFWHGSGHLGGTRHLYFTVVNLIRPDPTRAQAPVGVRRELLYLAR